jgi:glutamate-5-semialdehyde dehydrogenase
MIETLTTLKTGAPIPFGGDKVTFVPAELAATFEAGDRLVVVQESGVLLRVPRAVHAVADEAVGRAGQAFDDLATISDVAISDFFERFALKLAERKVWRAIEDANAADLAQAREAGRSTTRLAVSDAMRRVMVAGLQAWRDAPSGRGRVIERVEHEGWSVEQVTAPLGVVGFVFEGRPNVFADAAGVIRGGNTAVFRIGSDALRTARAIEMHALAPALQEAGLPAGAAVLLDSAERSAGWALFSDTRLALAVARGSGAAVAQLGAIARQAGTTVSLHGTGGAWLIADETADAARFAAAVANSIDRKVCNTLNVCCIVDSRAADLVPLFREALQHGRIHEGAGAELAREWEWEDTPEVWLTTAPDLDSAIALFNAHSPRFSISLISEDGAAHERLADRAEAAFVGDGFTRWVDGQYAYNRPELGLSNWQSGRLFARGGVLSGDGVFTLKTRMRQRDMSLRR